MNLVQVGHIGKAHGYKGAFILQSGSPPNPFPSHIDTVFVGADRETARPFKVSESAWMPKGIRLKLDGCESDTEVKSLRGNRVFVERDQLQAAQDGEYYVADLIGAQVIATETQTPIGTLSAIEEVGKGSTDRWWIQSGQTDFCIPASAQWIEKVDPSSKTIWVRSHDEFRSQ
jgi:16S rRNA processing protein RimM